MIKVLVGARGADIRPVLRMTPLAGVLLSVRTGIVQMLGWLPTRPQFSDGIIIPFVAGLPLCPRRDQIGRHRFTGSWSGLLLILMGAVAATTLAPYIPD
jgi:hypothetical protein